MVGLLLPGMFTVGKLSQSASLTRLLSCCAKLLYPSLKHDSVWSPCLHLSSSLPSIAYCPNSHYMLLFQTTSQEPFAAARLKWLVWWCVILRALISSLPIGFKEDLTLCHLSRGKFLPWFKQLQLSCTCLKFNIPSPTETPLQVVMNAISIQQQLYFLKTSCTVQQLNISRGLNFPPTDEHWATFYAPLGTRWK